jgi:hypothetical protein
VRGVAVFLPAVSQKMSLCANRAAFGVYSAFRLARSSSAASCIVSSRSGLHPHRHSIPATTPKKRQMSGRSSYIVQSRPRSAGHTPSGASNISSQFSCGTTRSWCGRIRRPRGATAGSGRRPLRDRSGGAVSAQSPCSTKYRSPAATLIFVGRTSISIAMRSMSRRTRLYVVSGPPTSAGRTGAH